MKFKQIKDIALSAKGKYLAIGEVPDRGNRDLVLYTAQGQKLLTIPRGESPLFSPDERWLAVTIGQDFFEKEKKPKDKFQPDLWIVDLLRQDTLVYKNVANTFFSPNSAWAFILRKPAVKKDSAATDLKAKPPREPLFELKELTILRLERRDTMVVQNVLEAAIDSTSESLYYATLDTAEHTGGLYRNDLLRGFSGITAIDTSGAPLITSLLAGKNELFGYVRSTLSGNISKDGSLHVLMGKSEYSIKQTDLPIGWQIPAKNHLQFSNDGAKLFFGSNSSPKEKIAEIKDSTIDENYSVEAITAKHEIDIWHWDDPMIKTQEKNLYKKNQEKLFTQAVDLENKKLLLLADSTVTEVVPGNNPRYTLEYTNIPYRKEISWDDYYYDAYVYDKEKAQRVPVISHILETPALSPVGSFAVSYKERKWNLFNCESGTSRTLNDTIKTPFSVEDWDLPALPASYGIGGWLADSAVFINDRYDIWMFSKNGTVKNITNGVGREQKISFRITGTVAGKEYYDMQDTLLLLATSSLDKSSGYYSLALANGELKCVTNEKAKFSFKLKAKEAPVYVFTKERYDLFPDIWLSNSFYDNPRKITDLDAQRIPFAWSKAELIHWHSTDGTPLDGILIKPTNYKEGTTFPLIVYFYELFSQRLFEFPDMVVNHRPNFAYYTSHGYGVLLPDVRFEIGEPGQSAIRCVVPGVLKLIEANLVDPKGVGLIGHSWSGYQAAFMITQTDLFSAAIAGAPVGNMTSAYSGIRNESGMTRQFQYEKSQSRIGGSLWEYPERYIANSPVFFADRINTPLLIEHGDEDEAVPFQQGVELYMAMRRLGKTCYFLEYRGEPHHPKKYPNKVDYAVKQKEFFDTYLKHQPLAPWMAKPTPYSE